MITEQRSEMSVGTGGNETAPVDFGSYYRQVIGHYPTGVSIITADVDGELLGMVVGSFSSVSVDPPLVSFFGDDRSQTFAALSRSASFCVNVLSRTQEPLVRQFVKSGADRFADVEWRRAASGSPILDGVVAWIDCDIESISRIGDHQMVVGRVRELGTDDPAPPLIFHRRGYGEFNPRALYSWPDRDLLDALKLVDLSHDVVTDLTAELGLECTVTAAIGDASVVLARVAPQSTELVGSPVGYRIPLVPPIGPALMAWATESELAAWFARSPAPLTDEVRQGYLAMLGRLREDGWTWFTKDTDFMRIQDLLDSAANEAMPGEEVLRGAQGIVGDPEFNFMPIPLEPGGRYEVYSVVAPVVLPGRDTVIGMNVLGGGAEFTAEEITRIGERLRAAADAAARRGTTGHT